jgi:hypothetical protein
LKNLLFFKIKKAGSFTLNFFRLIGQQKKHDKGILSTELGLRYRSRRTRSRKQKYTLDQLLHEHEEEERKKLSQKDHNKFLDEMEKEIEMAEKNTHFFHEELFEGQKELDQVLRISFVRILIVEIEEINTLF